MISFLLCNICMSSFSNMLGSKEQLNKSTVLVSIRWIWRFRHGYCPSPSHSSLATLSETAVTEQQQLCPQSRWHSSLPFVILIVENHRESIHSAQAEDLSFLKRLPRVEVIFSLPSHTAFTACVYSKDKNQKHAKKALPDCSQRATMPRCQNAFRETEKCIYALETEHKGSTARQIWK